MKKNIILYGGSGMLGQAFILEAQEHKDVERIYVINRREIGYSHSKIKELVVKDVGDLSSYKSELGSIDACAFPLGTTSAGKNEEVYTKITFDLTKNIAEQLQKINPNMSFLYVSGAGTDSSEKGRIMWARVKGKTENLLIDMFDEAYMFRPGYIQPMKGIVSSTKLYRILYKLFSFMYPLFKRIAPNRLVTSVELSDAMLNAIFLGYPSKILDPPDILKLAKK